MSEDTLVIVIEGEQDIDPVCVSCSMSAIVHYTRDGTRKIELKMSTSQVAILRRQLKGRDR